MKINEKCEVERNNMGIGIYLVLELVGKIEKTLFKSQTKSGRRKR
jgi:hypothetical protein